MRSCSPASSAAPFPSSLPASTAPIAAEHGWSTWRRRRPVCVMPLASPIGSGLGLLNPFGVRTIKRRLTVPVVVDAGVGTASDACLTMEQGVDGILMNTALAAARDPVAMGRAMRLAVEAGRTAYLAGRMPRREVALPSSPLEGMLD